MFSMENRCIYTTNPLAEVICQLRFPEILTIEANTPVDFQEAIRAEFPRYTVRKEVLPPRPGAIQEKPVPITNHQFATADGVWRVNMTSKFISLACSRYVSWEDFAAMLDKPLAAFIRVYKPAYFERVGLRYLNFISRKSLDLEGTPWRELIHPSYLGLLNEEPIQESSVARSTVDADVALRGGCRAKLHAGPGMVRRGKEADPEQKFILDLDLYMPGNVPVNVSAGALQTLHSQAYPLFRYAITDTLHDAMEPK